MLRKWSSERTQSVYRTLKGLMKNRAALEKLLKHQAPGLTEAERATLVASKFRLVAAVQNIGID